MGESNNSKADYKVVIDQEPEENHQREQQTVVAPSGIKLSPAMRAVLPVASYCCASILMTVTNKYVLSGYDFNMNFLLLTIQVLYIIESETEEVIEERLKLKLYKNRTWSQYYYYNLSNFSILSNFVDSIKKKHVNGYPLQLHLLP